MLQSTALLISDDSSLIEVVQRVVQPIDNLRLRVAARMEECLSTPRPLDDVLVLVHLAHKGDDALAARLLRMLASAQQPLPTLVLTSANRPKQILELLRLGAVDCLTRPLDLNRLSYLIDALTVRARYGTRTTVDAAGSLQNLGGDTPFLFVATDAMAPMMAQVQRVAPQNTTILLTGETGTGKTCLARVIHQLSPRRDKPFLVVNCGTLSANLIESELFGHVKGAFTGADRERRGKFADVGGGTLLLDEIDALPLALQTKLLRVVEERVYEPVGSNRACTMQARLIVASNRNLDQEVAEGRFRTDLYYRLNVVGFHLPPLCERRELISALVKRFIADFAAANDRSVQGISAEALQVLEGHHWSGNVRELRNVVERAVALCPENDIKITDLPQALIRSAYAAEASQGSDAGKDCPAPSPGTLAQCKDEIEYLRISQACSVITIIASAPPPSSASAA